MTHSKNLIYKLKKLPIGISTLRTILEEDYLYVDKTNIAQELIENGQYYFLSRPRRFGKSLMLDTLRTIFETNESDKELFKGLSIYDNGYEFSKHPVIRISFNNGDFSSKEGFEQTIIQILKENQKNLNIECENTTNAPFTAAIERCNQRRRLGKGNHQKRKSDQLEALYLPGVCRTDRELSMEALEEYCSFI